MADEDDPPTYEAVLWRGDGLAHDRPPALASIVIDLDDEDAFALLRRTILDVTGLDTAVLHVGDGVVHLEVLDGTADWSKAHPRPETVIAGRNVWNGLGWWRSMLACVEGCGLVGDAQVMKHWSISALVRVTDGDCALWWKQVPAFMAHEGAVVRWLNDLAPGSVPAVRAVQDDWWVAEAFCPLDEQPPTHLAALAGVQQRTVGRGDELVALGCPDRRVPRLVADLHALAERADLLEDALRARLGAALPLVDAAADRFDALGLPDALVHGDLHRGNVAMTEGGWLLYDWTDACLAPPTFDLGLLAGTHADAVRDDRIASYLGGFTDPALRAAAAAALDGPALGLAAGHHAISYQRIVDGLEGDDAVGWSSAITAHLVNALRWLAPA